MKSSSEYQKYYESRNVEKAVTSDNPHSLALIDIVREALDLQREDVVLDVGCSDGYVLQRLYEAVPFSKGVGIDISDYSVSVAKNIVKYANLDFMQGYGDDLPFEDESFDKIVCNEVIEHVPDDAATLRELYRVCRPGGRVYVTAPNALTDALPLFAEHCEKVDAEEGHLRRYSSEAMEALARDAGFEVESITYNGFIASYLWYSFVIYNRPFKKFASRLIRKDFPPPSGDSLPTSRPKFGLLAQLGFGAMRLVSALDRPFRNSRKNMGFWAILVKRHGETLA